MAEIKLPEINLQRLGEEVASHPSVGLFVYAPTCGTCQLAKKVMGVMEGALPGINFFQINLNHYPEIAAEYGIMSIPALLLYKDGQFVESVYRFEVMELFEKVQERLP